MTSKFFRFLSRRGSKSTKTNKSSETDKITYLNETTHSKALNIFGNVTSKDPINLNNKNSKQEANYDIRDHRKDKFDQSNRQKSKSSGRLFSFRSKKSVQASTDKNGQDIPKDSIEIVVSFLDHTEEHFYLPKKSLASKLYERVFYHLDLLETDYFGLQFSDAHNVKHWLDPTKLIKKQCKIGPPYQFFFKVKFYTAEPNNLKEELTRYFYFLQLRNDLRSGRLPCLQENLAVELCTLILQEELGDYDPQNHAIETISEFRFLPDIQQTEQFEELVLEKYATSTSYKAMSPGESELTFLNKAKWLEMYGVDMHSVFGRDNNEYKLGLTPSGILVFEEAPTISGDPTQGLINNKIGLFYWPKIEKVMFSKKKFTILVSEDDTRGLKQEHTFIFNLVDEKACKHLWKCAVEFHSFFRLKTSLLTANSFGLGVANGSGGGLFSGFIRKGSRFRGPERTEFQTHNISRMTMPRRSVQFERKPSQRFSRRASYAIKRKLQEQQKRGTSVNTSEILQNAKNETLLYNTSVNQPIPKTRSNSTNQSLSGSDIKINQVKNEPLEPSKSLSFNSKNKPNFNIGHDSKVDYNPKCNLLKANQIISDDKSLKSDQSHSIESQYSKNVNINKNYKGKIIDKQNILDTLEVSKQITNQNERPNIHNSGRDNVRSKQNSYNIPATVQNQATLPNLNRKSETVNPNLYNNIVKNTQVTRSSSDHNQIKSNTNTTMNRNLISFNNNVSIMKIKQQTMTEI